MVPATAPAAPPTTAPGGPATIAPPTAPAAAPVVAPGDEHAAIPHAMLRIPALTRSVFIADAFAQGSALPTSAERQFGVRCDSSSRRTQNSERLSEPRTRRRSVRYGAATSSNSVEPMLETGRSRPRSREGPIGCLNPTLGWGRARPEGSLRSWSREHAHPAHPTVKALKHKIRPSRRTAIARRQPNMKHEAFEAAGEPHCAFRDRPSALRTESFERQATLNALTRAFPVHRSHHIVTIPTPSASPLEACRVSTIEAALETHCRGSS